ncbi:MAG: hypothetical protein K2P81_04570 [Bacteriovoracaceae bacterium]|nr:hypothetical protein [Bacteriovoracaceae bacterium]
MLEITVLKSEDPDFEGVWSFQKNQIYFGHPDGDIAPSGLPNSFTFMLEVLPEFLQVHPHPDLEFWLLNGKRASKGRKVKIGDNIQVQNIEFKITAAKFQEFKTKKQILDMKLKQLISTEAPILNLIQLLNAKTK